MWGFGPRSAFLPGGESLDLVSGDTSAAVQEHLGNSATEESHVRAVEHVSSVRDGVREFPFHVEFVGIEPSQRFRARLCRSIVPRSVDRRQRCADHSPLVEVPVGELVVVDERSRRVFTVVYAIRKVCLRTPLLFLYGLLLYIPSDPKSGWKVEPRAQRGRL